jgi:hypothetical protein
LRLLTDKNGEPSMGLLPAMMIASWSMSGLVAAIGDDTLATRRQAQRGRIEQLLIEIRDELRQREFPAACIGLDRNYRFSRRIRRMRSSPVLMISRFR